METLRTKILVGLFHHYIYHIHHHHHHPLRSNMLDFVAQHALQEAHTRLSLSNPRTQHTVASELLLSGRMGLVMS